MKSKPFIKMYANEYFTVECLEIDKLKSLITFVLKAVII